MQYKPKRGDRVVCRGRLRVYVARGSYQMQVSVIQPAGDGALARELAARRERLEAEGLLDPRRKRALPRFPMHVGVATSLHGAALADVLKVSRERYPAARILVAPCTVQGDMAPSSVMRAVELLIEDGRSDVIVVTRGGGSKEDLLAFQDEQLARFLAHCPIPWVSAVGHEIDTSLVDLVADVVAPTPSAAALAVLPDGYALAQGIDELSLRMQSATQRAIAVRRERVLALRRRLRHPGERLAVVRLRARGLDERLGRAVQGRLHRERARLDQLRGQLDALSPLGVLDRGYAIVRGEAGLVGSPDQVRAGQGLNVRVRGGSFDVVVS